MRVYVNSVLMYKSYEVSRICQLFKLTSLVFIIDAVG